MMRVSINHQKNVLTNFVIRFSLSVCDLSIVGLCEVFFINAGTAGHGSVLVRINQQQTKFISY